METKKVNDNAEKTTDKGKKDSKAKGLPKGRTKSLQSFLAVFPELKALCAKYKVLRVELKLADKEGKTFSSVVNTTNSNLSSKFE
jgi:hypothetical protein